MAVEAVSQLQLSVDLRQFENTMFPRLEARLTLDRPVLGARVRADLYGPGDVLVAEGLTLRDDGQGGDLTADDGVYAATLDMILRDGEYSALVTAENPGGAVASSRGVYANNPLDTAQYALGSFQRAEEGTASLVAVRGEAARGCVLGGPGQPWDMGLAALQAGVAGIFHWRRRP